MRIVRRIKEMRSFSNAMHRKGKTIGFVPTMGALHQGHLSLIRRARQDNDKVVVSIFVNPIQFGPREDFRKYPRDLKRDTGMCRQEGVDIIFYPETKQMYSQDYKTYVFVDGQDELLCAKFRPGHFKGVATVVTKLLNIVSPDIAYFGQKDAQQAIIIKKLVCDLNIPVKIKVMPTIRENYGLALSSRNVYLNEDERKDACVLYQALNLAKGLIKKSNRNPSDIILKMRQLINKKKTAKIQYISIVDLKSLKSADKIRDEVLIALAVWFGKTRLIDNIIAKAQKNS